MCTAVLAVNDDNGCEFSDGDSWIGLYKYDDESESQSPSAQYWLDGSTSTFRRWQGDEPNDETYCVMIKKDSGTFDDKSCGNNKDFVCKRTGKK